MMVRCSTWVGRIVFRASSPHRGRHVLGRDGFAKLIDEKLRPLALFQGPNDLFRVMIDPRADSLRRPDRGEVRWPTDQPR